jgi:hypothetical protein
VQTTDKGRMSEDLRALLDGNPERAAAWFSRLTGLASKYRRFESANMSVSDAVPEAIEFLVSTGKEWVLTDIANQALEPLTSSTANAYFCQAVRQQLSNNLRARSVAQEEAIEAALAADGAFTMLDRDGPKGGNGGAMRYVASAEMFDAIGRGDTLSNANKAVRKATPRRIKESTNPVGVRIVKEQSLETMMTQLLRFESPRTMPEAAGRSEWDFVLGDTGKRFKRAFPAALMAAIMSGTHDGSAMLRTAVMDLNLSGRKLATIVWEALEAYSPEKDEKGKSLKKAEMDLREVSRLDTTQILAAMGLQQMRTTTDKYGFDTVRTTVSSKAREALVEALQAAAEVALREAVSRDRSLPRMTESELARNTGRALAAWRLVGGFVTQFAQGWVDPARQLLTDATTAFELELAGITGWTTCPTSFAPVPVMELPGFDMPDWAARMTALEHPENYRALVGGKERFITTRSMELFNEATWRMEEAGEIGPPRMAGWVPPRKK